MDIIVIIIAIIINIPIIIAVNTNILTSIIVVITVILKIIILHPPISINILIVIATTILKDFVIQNLIVFYHYYCYKSTIIEMISAFVTIITKTDCFLKLKVKYIFLMKFISFTKVIFVISKLNLTLSIIDFAYYIFPEVITIKITITITNISH